MKYNFIELREEMSQVLPAKRYYHVLGVEFTCAALAMRYEANMLHAQLGGLLHDCAKYLSDDDILKQCKKYNIEISDVEMRNPYLLHAKLGSLYANKLYGINEIEVLQAITYHTTGKPHMSLLEKIVFTADYIEPSRKEIPGLREIQKQAFIDLDIAVYNILKNTLSYLSGKKSNKEIDPLTEQAYEYYKELTEKRRKNNE